MMAMKVSHTSRFQKNALIFGKEIQNKLEKQIRFLLHDLQHPSLRAKKYDEAKGIWQARVDASVRFYFAISGDTYILHDIRKHRD